MTENVNSTWTIDLNHSEVQFKVKHLAVSNVAGIFKIFKGEVLCKAEDFDNAEISCEIDVDSIYTNQEKRDNDLRSPEFFDTEKFPKILFTGLLQKETDNYKLTGELTLRGIVKTVVMEAEFTGIGKGRFGDTRVGFEVTGKINRKDFGLTWNMLTEAGGFVIGDEIKLHFDIQLLKEKA